MTSFVPRPIYRIKPYAYLAEAGDTPMSIAQKFGRPAGDYRELVAANLEGRALMPMALGSPYGARTFAEELQVDEPLKIPAHWRDPSDTGGFLGDVALPGGIQVPDGIIQGLDKTLQGIATANGGSVPGVDPSLLPGITNAAAQWWMNTQGTLPATLPTQYLPYVTSAIDWVKTFGPQIAQQVNPQAVAAFPWGAFLALLPTQINPTQVDWEKCAPGSAMGCGAIPGANGALWNAIPWAYLASLGADLEQVKSAPIDWSNPTPAGLYAAFRSVLDAALARTIICGINAAPGDDGNCYCLPGHDWNTAVFDPNNPESFNCHAVSTGGGGGTTTPTDGGGTSTGGGTTTPTGGGTTTTGGSTTTTGGGTTTPTDTGKDRPPAPGTNALQADDGNMMRNVLIGAGVVTTVAVVAGAVALGMSQATPSTKKAATP